MAECFWTNHLGQYELGCGAVTGLCGEGESNGSLFSSDYFTVQTGTPVCDGICSSPNDFVRFTNTAPITSGNWTLQISFSTPAPFEATILLTSDDGLTDYSGSGSVLVDNNESTVLSVISAPSDEILRLTASWTTTFCVTKLSAYVSNGCFRGDTLVTTPTGDVPISAIQLGDTVTSFDATGTLTTSVVTLIDVYEREVFEYEFSNGVRLFATDNHRVLVQDGRFREFRYLAPADQMTTLAGEQVSLVSTILQASETVYNLKGLDGEQSYIANGIRVSNISYVLPGD